MSGVDQATFDQQRRWTQEAEAELKAAQARITELEAAELRAGTVELELEALGVRYKAKVNRLRLVERVSTRRKREIAAAQARIAELEAQAQRDFELAAEWKAALEAERVEHQILKDRVEALAANSLESHHGPGGRGIYAAELRGLLGR